MPIAPAPLAADLRSRWVIPLYMRIPADIPSLEAPLRALFPDITPQLIQSLLADPNWRPRITAGFLAALVSARELEDHIGRLLLRSDVCFAAAGYCLALARFNTDRSASFLREYLDYYLGRKDLWFDQATVLSAVFFLDAVNGTSHGAEFQSRWHEFVADKPHWDLARSRTFFSTAARAVEQLAIRMTTAP